MLQQHRGVFGGRHQTDMRALLDQKDVIRSLRLEVKRTGSQKAWAKPNSDSASFAVSDRTIVIPRATATRAIRSVTPSVAGTGRYGAASAGYRTSIGGVERFPDGIRDRAGANNRRLGHD